MRVSRKAAGIAAFSVVMAGFVFLMAWALINRAPVTGRSGFTRLHKPAPEFTLPLLEGGEFVLSQHVGDTVVINFWASWCPPCLEEAPVLERTWRAYRDRDLQFVGVEIQDFERDGRAYVSKFDITYPIGLDRDGRITVDYGVIGLPVTFLVNGEGVVERRWVGAIGEAQLTVWLDEMVAGTGPSGAVEGENLGAFFELE